MTDKLRMFSALLQLLDSSRHIYFFFIFFVWLVTAIALRTIMNGPLYDAVYEAETICYQF